MALKKLGHVVLKVRDLERSEAFYTRRPRSRRDRPAPGPDGLLLGARQHRLARSRPLEGGTGRGSSGADAQVGLFHVAWQVERVEDLQAFHDSLVARGVAVRATMDHGANLSVYFEDPDGHMLEVTYEKPRETWPPGQNPFAGREPLPFQAARR